MTAEQRGKVLERLRNLIPNEEWDETVIGQLVDDAEDWVLSYCHRSYIPDALIRSVGDLAIIAFNRLGTEGDSSRSEAGESYSFETAPAQVYNILNKYRLVRSGGHAYEKSKSTDIDN